MSLETLPLEVTTNLITEKLPRVEIQETSKGKQYSSLAGYRKKHPEQIKVSQYVSDLLPIRAFLLNHRGKPFLWANIEYICLEVQLEYKEVINGTVKGNISLTLERNNNT